MKIVLGAVQKQVELVVEAEKVLEMIDAAPMKQRNVFNYDAQIVKLREEIQKNQNYKLKLYENLQEGLIGQDEYFMFKENYAAKIKKAEEAIHVLEEDRKKAVSNNKEDRSWMEVFKKYANLSVLERKAVVELLECVRIFENRQVEVCFRYGDQCEKLFRIFDGMTAEEIARLEVEHGKEE